MFNGGPFFLSTSFILLLVAFVLYLLALLQVPSGKLDKVTTAQCLVVLWLLLSVGTAMVYRLH